MNNLLKRLLLLLLVSFVLGACSFERSVSVQTTEKEVAPSANEEEEIIFDFSEAHVNVASIGDSLTKGVGDTTDNGGYLPFLLQDLEAESTMKDVTINDYGKKGLSSAGLVKNLQKEPVQELISKADIVIITIGGNDVMNIAKKNYSHLKIDYFKEGIQSYEDNVRKVLDLIRTHNEEADIYLVGLYNPFSQWFQDIKEFDEIMVSWNERSKEITLDYKDVYFVEIASLFTEENENLIYEGDFFHPNLKGYEIMGNAIFESIQENTISHLQE